MSTTRTGACLRAREACADISCDHWQHWQRRRVRAGKFVHWCRGCLQTRESGERGALQRVQLFSRGLQRGVGSVPLHS